MVRHHAQILLDREAIACTLHLSIAEGVAMPFVDRRMPLSSRWSAPQRRDVAPGPELPRPYQGGGAALGLADRIARMDRRHTLERQDVTPEMEPDNAGLDNDESFDDDENEDVEPDMEPFDATIESSLDPVQRYEVEVNGDGSITITPDADEALVVDEQGDEVIIDIVPE
jgi:hypothetical protein